MESNYHIMELVSKRYAGQKFCFLKILVVKLSLISGGKATPGPFSLTVKPKELGLLESPRCRYEDEVQSLTFDNLMRWLVHFKIICQWSLLIKFWLQVISPQRLLSYAGKYWIRWAITTVNEDNLNCCSTQVFHGNSIINQVLLV